MPGVKGLKYEIETSRDVQESCFHWLMFGESVITNAIGP